MYMGIRSMNQKQKKLVETFQVITYIDEEELENLSPKEIIDKISQNVMDFALPKMKNILEDRKRPKPEGGE